MNLLRVPSGAAPRALFALLLLLCAGAALAAEDDAARFDALLAQAWQRTLQESPVFASYVGDLRYNDRWADLSPAAIERSHAQDRALLAQLDGIERAALDPARQLDYDLFRRHYQAQVEAYAFGGWMQPLTHQGGLQTAHELANQLRFTREQDYRDWIARLRAFDTLTAQTLALMRAGIDAGRVPPKVILQRVPAQIAQQRVSDATASPFYAPFTTLPEDFSDALKAELRAAAQDAIETVVLPAFADFERFFNEIYLPAAPQAIGLSEQPGGAPWYAWLARSYTTTELTPDEIHRIGLDEVARIQAEMIDTMRASGFDGELPAFFDFLRRDARFYLDDADAILDAYRVIAKRIDPELPRLFGRLPRLTYGVREIPAISAPDTTTAYYYPGSPELGRPGWFYANTYRPETRPTWEMPALTAHEAVPGHHLQIALQQEQGEVPPFRRHLLGFTAFVEGWGLYAESLGDEIGLYEDPYDKFGQLTYEMWRAVRLVVDTGMHAKGWSRQRAIDYFMAHAPKAELDIVNEIDRYIGTPGQALAYKIGQLRIRALRDEAQQALGDAFDLRAFHDTVLEAGPIPLDLLEARVDAWVERTRAAAAS